MDEANQERDHRMNAERKLGFGDIGTRRPSIAEELEVRIASDQAGNMRLKDLQELQGLLERNKTTARILELQRKLGL